jgi:hypothetical protein
MGIKHKNRKISSFMSQFQDDTLTLWIFFPAAKMGHNPTDS